MVEGLENIENEVYDCKNWFDFIVLLHCKITSAYQSGYITAHAKWTDKKENDHILNKIKKLTYSMGESQESFEQLRETWLELLEMNSDEPHSYILETLYCYDDVLMSLSKPISKKRLEKIGPLNSMCSSSEALFFFSQLDYLQKEFVESNKIRSERNLTRINPSGIGAQIKNYIVLKTNILGGMKPAVIKYNPISGKKLFSKEGISIAVIPFYFKEWFEVKRKDSVFEIEDKEEEERKNINAAYINAVNCAEKNECDIIVFPEMSLNADTLSDVTEYIRVNGGAFKNLKLIFTGSYWGDNTNCAYVLAANGAKLLEVRKKEPFSFFDVETGAIIAENLLMHNEQILFLDIDGIGRIAYTICRDGTDELQNNIKRYMGVNFNVISSYSNKLTPFDNIIESLSKDKAMITVFGNCCAATRKEIDNTVGFVCFPEIRSNKKIDAKRISYSRAKEKECFENCGYCKCIEVFRLKEKETVEKNAKKTFECTQKLYISD